MCCRFFSGNQSNARKDRRQTRLVDATSRRDWKQISDGYRVLVACRVLPASDPVYFVPECSSLHSACSSGYGADQCLERD